MDCLPCARRERFKINDGQSDCVDCAAVHTIVPGKTVVSGRNACLAEFTALEEGPDTCIWYMPSVKFASITLKGDTRPATVAREQSRRTQYPAADARRAGTDQTHETARIVQ